MGHITARHTVVRQSKQQLGQLLLISGMVASERFQKYAGYAMQGMQLLFLKFSREDERQADSHGTYRQITTRSIDQNCGKIITTIYDP